MNKKQVALEIRKLADKLWEAAEKCSDTEIQMRMKELSSQMHLEASEIEKE
jgi:hypothetical protein